MKRILITGGLGFIGTTLIETLLQDEDNFIVVVDDLSTSLFKRDTLYESHEVIKKFLNKIPNIKDRVSIKILSVADEFKSTNGQHINFYHEIYHLASPVGPASVITQGGRMVVEVVRDIDLIIQYCLKYKTKLLDVSTSEVYGGGDNCGLCSETTPKIFPHNTNMRMEYAIAKLAAETAVVNTCKVTDLWAVIIRPFNVAGKRQSAKGGFVIPRFVQQALNGEPYTIFGDGTDVRAFTHVQDIVDGMIRAMRNGDRGRVYNLGNNSNKIMIDGLPMLVNKALNVNNKTVYVDPKIIYGDYYESANDKYPDASRAIAELGWVPTRTINAIIHDYYLDYIQNGIKE